jgi:hypothetical protein
MDGACEGMSEGTKDGASKGMVEGTSEGISEASGGTTEGLSLVNCSRSRKSQFSWKQHKVLAACFSTTAKSAQRTSFEGGHAVSATSQMSASHPSALWAVSKSQSFLRHRLNAFACDPAS